MIKNLMIRHYLSWVIHTYTLEKYNWFEKVNEVKKWDDYNGIIDNLMVEDYENDDIPQFLEVESYDISDGDDEEWLTLTDSFLLGKVEKEYAFTSMPKIFPKRTESTFEYFERVWLKPRVTDIFTPNSFRST